MGNLTVRQIESSKPAAKPYKLMDGGGLQLRIAVDGHKTWLVRYHVAGLERQYSLPRPYKSSGGEGFCSLQEARDEASAIKAMAREGIDYQVKLKQDLAAAQQRQHTAEIEALNKIELRKIDELTIKDLFLDWLKDGVRRKDANAELSRSFSADVPEATANKHVKSATEHDFRALLRAMVARGVDRSAVVMYNNLRQMFSWAERRQPWRRLLVDGNPMDLIEIEKIVSSDYDMDNRRDRVLPIGEIKELRDIFKNMEASYNEAGNKRTAERPFSPVNQCAVWIMLSTLCRVGETSMARWEHINFELRTWFIPKANVKDSLGDMLIYLSDFALGQFRLLHQITGSSQWCFPARNNPTHVCVKSISKQVGDRQCMFKKGNDGKPRRPMKNRKHDNTLVLGNGVHGSWTPNDLRRTGATMMQGLGVSLETIDRCQNHVLPGSKVRRHYLHYDYADEKSMAWRLLGERLDAVLIGSNVIALQRAA